MTVNTMLATTVVTPETLFSPHKRLEFLKNKREGRLLPYGFFYGCFLITTTIMSAPITTIAISKAALIGRKYRSAALGA
jgi:hypothetical protein